MHEQLKNLIGKPLEGFTIKEYIEIVELQNGVPCFSRGILQDEFLAECYLEFADRPQTYHPAEVMSLSQRKTLVLTDGVRAFQLDSMQAVTLFSEADLKVELEQKAHAQLEKARSRLESATTPNMRKLLNV